jgi:hypothetical protein
VQRGVRPAAGRTTAAVLAAVILVTCAAGPPGPQSATAAASVAQFPTPRDRHMAVASGGKVYVMGGWIGSTGQKRLDVYDPMTNQWTRRADMLSAIQFRGCQGWNRSNLRRRRCGRERRRKPDNAVRTLRPCI